MFKECDEFQELKSLSQDDTGIYRSVSKTDLKPELVKAVRTLQDAYYSHGAINAETRMTHNDLNRVMRASASLLKQTKHHHTVREVPANRSSKTQHGIQPLLSGKHNLHRIDKESQSSFATMRSRLSSWMSRLFSGECKAGHHQPSTKVKPTLSSSNRVQQIQHNSTGNTHKNVQKTDGVIYYDSAGNRDRVFCPPKNTRHLNVHPQYVHRRWHEIPQAMLGDNENFGLPKKKTEKNQNEDRDYASSSQPKEENQRIKSKLKKKKKKTRSTDSDVNEDNESKTLKPKDVRKLNITEIKLPGRAAAEEEKVSKNTVLNAGQEAENDKTVTKTKPLKEKRPRTESQSDYTLKGGEPMEVVPVKKRKRSKVFGEVGATLETVGEKHSNETVDRTRNTRPKETNDKPHFEHQFPDSLHSAEDRNELRSNITEDHNEGRRRRVHKRDETKSHERESVQKYTKENDAVGYEIQFPGRPKAETTESDRSESKSLPKHHNRKESHKSSRSDLVGDSSRKGHRSHERKQAVQDKDKYKEEESADNYSEQYHKSYDHPENRDRQRHRHRRRNSNGSEEGRSSRVYDEEDLRSGSCDHRKRYKAHSLPPRIRKRTSSEEWDRCSCMSERRRHRVADNYETKRHRCFCDCDSLRSVSQCRESRCSRPDDELIEVLSEMCSDMENRLFDETFHSAREIRPHYRAPGIHLGRYLSPDTLTLLDAIEHPVSTSSTHGRKLGCTYSPGLPPRAPRRRPTDTDMERPSCQCSPTVGPPSQKVNPPSTSVVNTCPIYYAVPQPVPVTAMAAPPAQPTATWYQSPLPVTTTTNVLLRSNPVSLIAPHQVSSTPTIYNPLMVPNITSPAVQSSMLFPSFAYCQRI
ncbi:hypothetical protein PHET_01301 [Paragonimus heterotremus]|uniref:Uncharacterized protein n=1 Tax=Paragonimus heterotremus TaxID=100268 RepID=A0A8J4STN4_9TREM|nr:hypothetical protein PHET_01301 [Paragonimus heterotremus]